MQIDNKVIIVTGSVKLGDICKQNLHGLIIKLQLTITFKVLKLVMLLKILCYVDRKQMSFTKHVYHKQRPRKAPFLTCVIGADVPGFCKHLK